MSTKPYGISPRSAAEETWRVFRIMAEFVEGFDVMSRIGPAVSIFGSARTKPDDKYYKLAADLARRLVERIRVITGAAPNHGSRQQRRFGRAAGRRPQHLSPENSGPTRIRHPLSSSLLLRAQSHVRE